MKVITSRKIISPGRAERSSNLDGKSSTDSIKSFQSWYNKNKSGNLVVDGKWGPKTRHSWQEAGKEYDAYWKKVGIGVAFGLNTPQGGGAPASNTSTTDPNGRRKAGHVWDKTKGAWTKATASGAVKSAGNILDNLFGGTKAGQKVKQALGKDGKPVPDNPSAPEEKTPAPETKKKFPWGWVAGAAGLAIVIGIAIKSSKPGK